MIKHDVLNHRDKLISPPCQDSPYEADTSKFSVRKAQLLVNTGLLEGKKRKKFNPASPSPFFSPNSISFY